MQPATSPNGIINDSAESCNPNTNVSHCCGMANFVCLSNGLCWDTIQNHLIRGTCTDKSWNDPRCPQYCRDDTKDTYRDLRQCNGQDERWVCGQDISGCTSDNSFPVPAGYIEDNRSTSLSAIVALPTAFNQVSIGTGPTITSQVSVRSGSTATTTLTVTSTARVADNTTAQSSPKAKSSDALTIGLGAGLGVGLPLLAALCVSLFSLYRAHKELKATQRGQYDAAFTRYSTPAHTPKWLSKQEPDRQNVHEVPGSTF